MSKDLHILAGAVLVVLLSLFAASLFAAPSLAVPADSASSEPSEIHTTNFFAENGKLECGQQAQSCGLAVECCVGFFCSHTDVCVRCAGLGEACGAGAGGVSCCPGNYCYMGSCEGQTLHFCSDSEFGPNYYSAGSATGDYEGNYGTYVDYCMNDNTVVDYYCTVNNEYAPIEAGIVTCPSGCSSGACN